MLYMCFFTFSFTSHALFINLNTDLFILCFIYIILLFIIKNIYAALSELSAYIDSDLKHDVCECCIYNVINLSNDCECIVNQHCDYCTQKHKHCCNVKYILVEIWVSLI